MANLIIVNGNVLIVGGAVSAFEEPVPIVVSPGLVSPFFEGANAQVRITLSDIQSQNVLVDYTTQNGTAFVGVDFTLTAGTATIPAGQLFVDVLVPTLLRSGYQGNRVFNFNLSNARLADATAITISSASLSITIQETESPGGGIVYPTLSVVPGVAVEGNLLGMQVNLSFPYEEDIEFTYATANGTAIAGTDYTTTNGTGAISAGQTSAIVSVPTTSRSGYQGSRSFSFTISNGITSPSGDPIAIVTASNSGIITDTESPTGSNAHFDTQIARPEIIGGENVGYFSLRTQASIDAIAGKDVATNKFWEYLGGADEHPEAQDAAKLVMFHSLATGSQLRVRLNDFNLVDGTVVFGVDHYMASDCYYNINPDGGLNHKHINIMDGGDKGAGDSIYMEVRALYRPVTQTYPLLAIRDLRTYGQGNNVDNEGPLAPEGVVRNTPYEPTGPGAATVQSVVSKVGKKLRYWYEIKLSQPGTAFTDWDAAYNTSGYPLGTRNISSATYSALNQIQTLRLDNLKATTVLSFNFGGNQSADLTTAQLATGVAAGNVQTALENMASIGSGNVEVRELISGIEGSVNLDVEFKGTFAGTNQALLTVNSTTGTPMIIMQKISAGSYTVITVNAAYDWFWRARDPMPTKVTIAGNSNGSLNGVKDAWPLSQTQLAIDVNAPGTGGTISRHFHMFSCWMADEDAGSTVADWRVYYRVPVIIRDSGKLLSFAFELNTSDKITQILGAGITEPPTIANPTVLTVPGHNFTTGQRTVIAGCTSIPTKNYRVTVIDADHISIPVEVTTTADLYVSGVYNGTYGKAVYPLVQYWKNWYGLRNFTLSEADTTIFAKPT